MKRDLTAALSAALLILVAPASAGAIEPVDMGDAHEYSVVANAATSTGATAMSDNLVTKKASRRKVRRGRSISWTIVVRNCGEHAASEVSVTDRLRRGATFKTGAGGRLADGRLSWKLPSLAPGARRTYRIKTRFNRNARLGRYINSATADAHNAQFATGHGSTRLLAHIEQDYTRAAN